MTSIFYDRFWTKQGRPFGFLLCPGDDGGQSLTIRVGRRFLRLEVELWLE